MGQPELRGFCLVKASSKKRELIALLFSRAGERLLLLGLGMSASPMATESFHHSMSSIPLWPSPARCDPALDQQ
jgi:hypothetical protein